MMEKRVGNKKMELNNVIKDVWGREWIVCGMDDKGYFLRENNPFGLRTPSHYPLRWVKECVIIYQNGYKRTSKEKRQQVRKQAVEVCTTLRDCRGILWFVCKVNSVGCFLKKNDGTDKVSFYQYKQIRKWTFTNKE